MALVVLATKGFHLFFISFWSCGRSCCCCCHFYFDGIGIGLCHGFNCCCCYYCCWCEQSQKYPYLMSLLLLSASLLLFFAAPTRSCLLLSKLNNTIYVLFSIWLHSAFDIQFRFGAIPLHSIRIRIDAVFMFMFGAWTNMSFMLFSWFCYFVLKEL